MTMRLPGSSRSARRMPCPVSCTIVPGGTGTIRSGPALPYIFLPMPASPRGACQWCLPMKSGSVFLLGSAAKMTSPPRPPSPPSGPPLGMYFSRRKETHPAPPSPALTWMVASSTNMDADCNEKPTAEPWALELVRAVSRMLRGLRFADVDFASLELDLAILEREDGVVAAE